MILRIASRSLTCLRPRYASSCSRAASRLRMPTPTPAAFLQSRQTFPSLQPQRRSYATATEADEVIEEITELYATARDEFEIAAEETEKKTVYAADDRAAAQEELKKLKDYYEHALKTSSPEVSADIKRRVGQRIRELDHAVQGMEEAAKEDGV